MLISLQSVNLVNKLTVISLVIGIVIRLIAVEASLLDSRALRHKRSVRVISVSGRLLNVPRAPAILAITVLLLIVNYNDHISSEIPR